jgi:hypothetical protein
MEWFADVTGRRRIEIPEIGGWIECRQELGVGEKRAIFSRAFKGQVPLEDGNFRNEYDMQEVSFGQVMAYLADWSSKKELIPEAVRALKPEVFAHIEAAVHKHIENLEKNEQAAATGGRSRKQSAAPILQSANA